MNKILSHIEFKFKRQESNTPYSMSLDSMPYGLMTATNTLWSYKYRHNLQDLFKELYSQDMIEDMVFSPKSSLFSRIPKVNKKKKKSRK